MADTSLFILSPVGMLHSGNAARIHDLPGALVVFNIRHAISVFDLGDFTLQRPLLVLDNTQEHHPERESDDGAPNKLRVTTLAAERTKLDRRMVIAQDGFSVHLLPTDSMVEIDYSTRCPTDGPLRRTVHAPLPGVLFPAGAAVQPGTLHQLASFDPDRLPTNLIVISSDGPRPFVRIVKLPNAGAPELPEHWTLTGAISGYFSDPLHGETVRSQRSWLPAYLWFAALRARELGLAPNGGDVPYHRPDFVRAFGPDWYRHLCTYVHAIRDEAQRPRLALLTEAGPPTLGVCELGSSGRPQKLTSSIPWPFGGPDPWSAAMQRYWDANPDGIIYKQ